MRTILHIGMPKTATTSIQNSLAQAYDELLERGILYPLIPGHGGNHFFLGTATRSEKDLPRAHKQQYTGAAYSQLKTHTQNFMAQIDTLVKAHKPKTLVLSSEILSQPEQLKSLQKLKSLLKPYIQNLDIVLYVRDPASYYLSATQQLIKASSTIIDPYSYHVPYKEIIQSYEEVFGTKVHIVALNKNTLKNQCAVQEFIHQFLPEIEQDNVVKVINQNESLSAESAYVMQKFRHHVYAGTDDKFNVESSALNGLLRQISPLAGAQKPVLKPAFKKHITTRHKDEINWLKDERDITFSDEIYKICDSKKTEKPPENAVLFSDIADVDTEKADKIAYTIMNLLIQNLLKAQKKT